MLWKLSHADAWRGFQPRFFSLSGGACCTAWRALTQSRSQLSARVRLNCVVLFHDTLRHERDQAQETRPAVSQAAHGRHTLCSCINSVYHGTTKCTLAPALSTFLCHIDGGNTTRLCPAIAISRHVRAPREWLECLHLCQERWKPAIPATNSGEEFSITLSRADATHYQQ